MTTATEIPQLGLNLGQLARRCGIPEQTARGLLNRGVIKPSGKVGKVVVFLDADLPAVEEALRRAGYLKDAEPGVEGGGQ